MDIQKKTSRKWYKILKFITESAFFALLLSIAFFAIESYNNNKEFDTTLKGLQKIEQSLSTKHIGIFPDYLNEINNLLAETLEKKHSENDTAKIIIFEDVLFYGAFYKPDDFKEMIRQLTELSSKKEIVIAYYNDTTDWRNGQMFREVIQESWIKPEDLSRFIPERDAIVDSLRKIDSSQNEKPTRERSFHNLLLADSIVSEKYFVVYRDDKDGSFSERRKKILVPFYDASKKTTNYEELFKSIDRIKNKYLDKPERSITFHDVYMLYYLITEELKKFFEYKIKLIPLNNYLTMSCWSNGEQALFALPGRFAADEIGFTSHDPAILKYIDVMLKGIENLSREKN